MTINQPAKHEEDVAEFLKKVKEEQPERYRKVCESYPVVTRGKLATIWRKEVTAGLLGLTNGRISPGAASRADIDTSFYDE